MTSSLVREATAETKLQRATRMRNVNPIFAAIFFIAFSSLGWWLSLDSLRVDVNFKRAYHARPCDSSRKGDYEIIFQDEALAPLRRSPGGDPDAAFNPDRVR